MNVSAHMINILKKFATPSIKEEMSKGLAKFSFFFCGKKVYSKDTKSRILLPFFFLCFFFCVCYSTLMCGVCGCKKQNTGGLNKKVRAQLPQLIFDLLQDVELLPCHR